ncbi:MAG: methyltransferase domain-containing protein [Phycisphaera sp.]|nr:methyltransferase domain-containing protein [Phycisphaera sp.]
MTTTTHTSQVFDRAQECELSNWVKDVSNVRRILYELVEHSDPADHLRRLRPDRRYERCLEVGVGCYGLGFAAVHLADRIDAIDGLDPLPRLDLTPDDPALAGYVEQVRARVKYIESPGESIPAEDASYDLVCSVNVVDHARDPHAIIREINRVLRPGGVLVFSVSTLSLLGQIKWAVKKRLKPNEWHHLAHPHTFRWATAVAMLAPIRGARLWTSGPRGWRRVLGRGRMSYWIIEKDA